MQLPVRSLLAVAALAAASLAGCATVDVGSTEAGVLEVMGTPSAVSPLPDGGRQLDYAGYPLRTENWRITVDRDGRVMRSEQLLEEENLEALQEGMSEGAVLATLGPPARTREDAKGDTRVLSWLTREIGGRNVYFDAHFDAATGRLAYTEKTPDPMEIFGRSTRRRR
jgi:outer membrane protein assembly factor BamE (lipoprotein component of BamABCDE complex)